MSGTRSNISHAWLEVDEWIIDITSDQFDDGCSYWLIDKGSKFHNSFNNQNRSYVGITPMLNEAYQKFKILMDSYCKDNRITSKV